jgi:hypothetical protein
LLSLGAITSKSGAINSVEDENDDEEEDVEKDEEEDMEKDEEEEGKANDEFSRAEWKFLQVLLQKGAKLQDEDNHGLQFQSYLRSVCPFRYN